MKKEPKVQCLHTPTGKIFPFPANLANPTRLKKMNSVLVPVGELKRYDEDLNTEPEVVNTEAQTINTEPPVLYSKNLHWTKAAKILKEMPEAGREQFLQGETRQSVLKHK